MEKEKPKSKRKNLDLIILLSALAVSMICCGAYTRAQLSNLAEGEDFDVYIDNGGLAFQDGLNPSNFIALYTPRGNIESSDNEFFISYNGGKFTFLSNNSIALQFLMTVTATIEGDQGNNIRAIEKDADGLSGYYIVDPGDRVTVYWMYPIDYGYALPIISFWGMIGGVLLGSVFTGAGIKRKQFKVLIVGLIAYLAAFIFYLVFVNI